MFKPEKIKNIVSDLPQAPGVYFFKDESGRIIYIGKAKSLKKRVQSYFSRRLDTKTQNLVSRIYDIEYKPAASEAQALIMEAGFIHRYQPKYNVSLRENKNFPFVKITAEEYPAICITRKKQPDGARYLGPYTSANLLREVLKIIRRSFPYRSCKELPRRACIYYRLGLSPAPCEGKINKKEYARTIKNISLILEGRTASLIKKLSQRMRILASRQDFEGAAKARDQIAALAALSAAGAGSSSYESEGLKSLLKLKRYPMRIEAFDISNISGKDATGSMVSFYQGQPDKNNYRRFRIKTVYAIDDYDMLREVVRRRYLRLIQEKSALPDVILIDGGKGHLEAAGGELAKLGLKIPLMSLAKEEENIYFEGRASALRLKEGSPVLNLIRRIRDEAHRFALSYHHLLRRNRIFQTRGGGG
ncbi:MAG: excinuclease ABC subunit UvrC [Candidatus Omnitrophica bacterium]|nr:excinuclease ABC subunit UvrC [Candidatus Omnitrophota bacterium]